MYTVQYLLLQDMILERGINDDVNGKPTVKNMSIQVNQNDEFLYVVSGQHWAYSWLANYCIVSLPCFCLQQVQINQGIACAQDIFFQN